jgi:hypothetical protein
MLNLIDNGDILTLKGVQESLAYRQINQQEVLIFSIFTLLFLALIFTLIVLVHYNKFLKIVWGVFGLYVLFTLTIAFKTIYGLELFQEVHQLNFLRIFYMCDSVIIVFGYAFKMSYEWINLLVFVIIEPFLGLYLLALLGYRKFYKNKNQSHLI